ncbi:zinc-alpha-2-glycoprotein-like [Dromiciops gliroides]|uniref:zinc-alpha-2-glycoprotein-like n=1 Tax=Dromiciops gliroides TaxID=33562 RepID=UPI001CC50531|nr:zinc-alpha-2-glycoprotein-like [Dromiciops gliroides]
MGNWRRRSFSSWMLILMLFAFRKTQAVYHWHEHKFTIVGTRYSLLYFTGVGVIDDIQWLSYDKMNHQATIKADWISDVLRTNLIEEWSHLIKIHEGDAQALIQFLTADDSKLKRNYTLQYFLGCELDDTIQLNSKVQFGLDGENMIEIDDHQENWVVLNPRAQNLKYIAESLFWTNVRKDYVKKYCVGMVQNFLRNSSMKENLPPEVYVSHHDSPNGTITLSCLATGFYPRSILLIWKKTTEQATWGKESSSGTLPNTDDTFYLQVTLELLPGDSGAGYNCVVEHSAMEKPAVYPVPVKPPKKWPWAMVISILVVFILGLSCAKVFSTWNNKKKTGMTSQSQLEGPISSPTIHLQ